jgi:hypothetical protein
MFCQQYEREAGCTNCVTGGCAKQNSCDMERCIKQCGDMTARCDQPAQSPSSKQAIAILQCNRRCQRSSCQILNNFLKKLEKEYQLEG